MRTFFKVAALAAALSSCVGFNIANAVTVGVTVDGIGSSNVVGVAKDVASGAHSLPGTAIEYFIPLTGSNCTYGVGGCGTSSDVGNGGTILSMFLKFSPIAGPANLSVLFEDLDLRGVNDPNKFFESINIFDKNGTSRTGGRIKNISSLLVTGNAATQQILSLFLPASIFDGDTLWLQLDFKAKYKSKYKARNTPEYLIAKIEAVTPVPLPMPAGFALFGLVSLGVARWSGRSKAVWKLPIANS